MSTNDKLNSVVSKYLKKYKVTENEKSSESSGVICHINFYADIFQYTHIRRMSNENRYRNCSRSVNGTHQRSS